LTDHTYRLKPLEFFAQFKGFGQGVGAFYDSLKREVAREVAGLKARLKRISA
jgi:hypothetical protein